MAKGKRRRIDPKQTNEADLNKKKKFHGKQICKYKNIEFKTKIQTKKKLK